MSGRWGLDCRHVQHALWDYVSDRLGEGTLERVERHLQCCARCAREVEAFRRTLYLLRASQETIPAPRAGWKELCDRIATLESVGQDPLLRQQVPAVLPGHRPSLRLRQALIGSVALLIVAGAGQIARFYPASPVERRIAASTFPEARTAVAPDTPQDIPRGSRNNARIASSLAMTQRPGDPIVLLPSGVLFSLSGAETTGSLPGRSRATSALAVSPSSTRARAVRQERARTLASSPGRTPSHPALPPAPVTNTVPSMEQRDTHYVIGVLTPVHHENEVY